jgi:chemotaxis protein MotB
MADDSQNNQPIIIVKKKGGHGGHHGGAWKVAYADFVTAMMAFFLVMWLVTQTDDIRQAVSNYFNDPTGYLKDRGNSVFKGGATPLLPGTKGELSAKLERERSAMLDVARRIRAAIDKMPELAGLKEFIEIEITKEGLRIQLIDSDNNKGNFFDIGSAKIKPRTALLLTAVAEELGKLPNFIIVEGHTDSRGYTDDFGYSNWELSADRANSARKLLMSAGIPNDQIVEIRGFADRRPRLPDNPADPRNRRIAIILLNEESARKYHLYD